MYHLDSSLLVTASSVCPSPWWPLSFLPTPPYPHLPQRIPSGLQQACATINVGLTWLGSLGG